MKSKIDQSTILFTDELLKRYNRRIKFLNKSKNQIYEFKSYLNLLKSRYLRILALKKNNDLEFTLNKIAPPDLAKYNGAFSKLLKNGIANQTKLKTATIIVAEKREYVALKALIISLKLNGITEKNILLIETFKKSKNEIQNLMLKECSDLVIYTGHGVAKNNQIQIVFAKKTEYLTPREYHTLFNSRCDRTVIITSCDSSEFGKELKGYNQSNLYITFRDDTNTNDATILISCFLYCRQYYSDAIASNIAYIFHRIRRNVLNRRAPNSHVRYFSH